MNENYTLEQYKEAYREIVKEKEKRNVLFHLIIYLIINSGIIIFNLFCNPRFLYFIFPLVFWGFGLLLHYLNSIKYIDKEIEKEEKLAELKVREQKKQD